MQEMFLKPEESFEFSSITQISIISDLFTGWIRRSAENVQIRMSQNKSGILKCLARIQLPVQTSHISHYSPTKCKYVAYKNDKF